MQLQFAFHLEAWPRTEFMTASSMAVPESFLCTVAEKSPTNDPTLLSPLILTLMTNNMSICWFRMFEKARDRFHSGNINHLEGIQRLVQTRQGHSMGHLFWDPVPPEHLRSAQIAINSPQGCRKGSNGAFEYPISSYFPMITEVVEKYW